MNKNKIIGIVAAIGAILLVMMIMTKPTGAPVSTDSQPAPAPGPAVGGAVPDSPFPYFSFGGVRRWAYRTDNFNQATTTVCAIQSPAATSTLASAEIRFDVSSSTATTVTVAKSATAFATTTLLGGQISIGAGNQSTIVASSTASQIFAPSQWLVVGMQGGIGTFSPSGLCEATFIQI